MIISPTTHMLKVPEVALELNVGKSTAQNWVYGTKTSDPCLASFTKGEVRLVSLENLTRFVLLHTVNPRRPDWLTAPIESNFQDKLREMTRLVCQAELQKFRLEMNNERIAA